VSSSSPPSSSLASASPTSASASSALSSSSVRRESNWIREEGGVRYACVGVAIGRRRGVDGPATGDDAPEADVDADAATSRCLGLDGVKTAAASAISTSSPSPPSPSDEDEVAKASCALLTGMTRVRVMPVEEAEEEGEGEARRGRFFFDGVSGAKTPSSSSEADTTSESEKETLRFALLVSLREGVVRFTLESRIADFVGEADRECDGVLAGVFIFGVDADAAPAEAASANFFSRISLIVARMDSFKSMHSSFIIFTRLLKSLNETPCLLTNDISCTCETWAGR